MRKKIESPDGKPLIETLPPGKRLRKRISRRAGEHGDREQAGADDAEREQGKGKFAGGRTQGPRQI